MKKKFFSIILIMILSISTVGCSTKRDEDPLSKTELFMGTVIKVTLYDHQSEEIMNKVFDRLKEIDDIVSINKGGTEIDKVNENAGIKPVKVSDTSYEVVSEGLKYSEISDGGYDITIGPLVKLWNIGLPGARVPTQEEINDAISHIGHNKIKLNESKKEIYLEEKGMKLDLGSIAKGYATDEAVKILKENGVKRAIVDLGGNIFAMGSKSKDQGWNIGVQDPFEPRGTAIGSMELSNKTIVTSGVYERFLKKNGKIYHHILNPKTGYPYETDIEGVTIVADKSVVADGWSTLIFAKGLKEGFKFIESQKGVDAVFITNDKKVYVTDGLKDNFKLLKSDFKLEEFKDI